MIEITEALVLDLLNEAVAEKGEDHVYENPDAPGMCTYVHGYQTVAGPEGESETVQVEPLTPGCIVGNVLHRAGIPLELFQQLEINDDTPADAALRHLADQGFLTYTGRAQSVLAVAQSHQDKYASWGAAVEAATHIL